MAADSRQSLKMSDPIRRKLVIVVNLTAPSLIFPVHAFVGAVSRGTFKHFLVEIDPVTALVGVVLKHLPWQRMMVVADGRCA